MTILVPQLGVLSLLLLLLFLRLLEALDVRAVKAVRAGEQIPGLFICRGEPYTTEIRLACP